MTTEVHSDDERGSGWSRMPEQQLESRSEAVRTALREGGHEVAALVGKGLRKASDVLGSSEASELDSMIGGTDLPELEGEDALRALALRLDREADYWRALALRSVARLAWADRSTHAASVVSALGCTALAVVAGMDALLGAASLQRVALVIAGVIALAAGAAIVGWASASIRKAQREVVRESLVRSDLAELRLHRLAVVLAIRSHDASGLGDALKRLEREVGAPSR